MEQKNSDVLKVTGINSKGFGIFPKLVSKDRRLTIEAVGIYAYICSYAGSGNSAFPSVATILYDLGIGETRYRTHLKLLVKYGYITIEQIRSEKGRFKHNVYTLHTEILEPDEEKEPYPQNRGTVKNEENQPYPQNRGTVDPSTDSRGTKNNNLKNNNEEEDEEVPQTENHQETDPGAFPKRYLELALKVGATKEDLAISLEKMDATPDIKNPVAWLQNALKNEVMNRELKNRPKNLKDKKPSTTQARSTRTPKKTKVEPDKYEKFYL